MRKLILIASILLSSVLAAEAKSRVFMFEGLGGVLVPYDTGVRAAAKEIARRCPGAEVSVHWHGTTVVEPAKQAFTFGKKLVFIGHSMGGRAAVREAMRVSPLPVAYVGSVDPVWRLLPPIPSNVERNNNWTQDRSLLGRGTPKGSNSVTYHVGHIALMYDRRVVNTLVREVCAL